MSHTHSLKYTILSTLIQLITTTVREVRYAVRQKAAWNWRVTLF